MFNTIKRLKSAPLAYFLELFHWLFTFRTAGRRHFRRERRWVYFGAPILSHYFRPQPTTVSTPMTLPMVVITSHQIQYAIKNMVGIWHYHCYLLMVQGDTLYICLPPNTCSCFATESSRLKCRVIDNASHSSCCRLLSYGVFDCLHLLVTLPFGIFTSYFINIGVIIHSRPPRQGLCIDALKVSGATEPYATTRAGHVVAHVAAKLVYSLMFYFIAASSLKTLIGFRFCFSCDIYIHFDDI